MPSQPAPKSCATCARADCQLVTSPADCGRWTSTDDPITAADIAADLAPHDEKELKRRKLGQFSEWDLEEFESALSPFVLAGGLLSVCHEKRLRESMRSAAE